MKFVVETNLADFNAWSGGKRNLEDLIEHPKAYEYIESFINESNAWSSDMFTETDINDYLWFDMYDDLKEAGFVNEDHEWIDRDDEDDF